MQDFDVIALGGGVYASGIAGLSFLKKHIEDLWDKKLIAFFVGALPYEESNFRQMVSRNMKDQLSLIPSFTAEAHGIWRA